MQRNSVYSHMHMDMRIAIFMRIEIYVLKKLLNAAICNLFLASENVVCTTLRKERRKLIWLSERNYWISWNA